jgi:hypothetical protein
MYPFTVRLMRHYMKKTAATSQRPGRFYQKVVGGTLDDPILRNPLALLDRTAGVYRLSNGLDWSCSTISGHEEV